MRPCDLLLAGAMETDHGMEVNCEEKYNFFLFFIRTSSPITLKMI